MLLQSRTQKRARSNPARPELEGSRVRCPGYDVHGLLACPQFYVDPEFESPSVPLRGVAGKGRDVASTTDRPFPDREHSILANHLTDLEKKLHRTLLDILLDRTQPSQMLVHANDSECHYTNLMYASGRHLQFTGCPGCPSEGGLSHLNRTPSLARWLVRTLSSLRVRQMYSSNPRLCCQN